MAQIYCILNKAPQAEPHLSADYCTATSTMPNPVRLIQPRNTRKSAAPVTIAPVITTPPTKTNHNIDAKNIDDKALTALQEILNISTSQRNTTIQPETAKQTTAPTSKSNDKGEITPLQPTALHIV